MSRGALDRLLVRVPALAPPVAGAIRRIRPGAPIRQRLVREQVRRTFAAMARGDVDLVLLNYEPDAELEIHGMAAVGVSERYHGTAGIRAFWADIDEAFADWRWDLREVVDGGSTMAIRGDLHGHGRGSGVEFALPGGGSAVRFSDRGLVAWQAWYVEDGAWEKALDAAGLRVTDLT